jgi:hypothetical protein
LLFVGIPTFMLFLRHFLSSLVLYMWVFVIHQAYVVPEPKCPIDPNFS